MVDVIRVANDGGNILELVATGDDPSGPDRSNQCFLYFKKGVGPRVKEFGKAAENLFLAGKADADDAILAVEKGVANGVATLDGAALIPIAQIPVAAVDHNALANLAVGDVHTQYALLAGRAGGQIMVGGTAANEDAVIKGTSNATFTSSSIALENATLVNFFNSNPGGNIELRVGNSNSAIDSNAFLTLRSANLVGGADVFVKFTVDGDGAYAWGVDGSDAGKLKLTTGATPSSGTNLMTTDASGNFTFAGNVTINGAGIPSLTLKNDTGYGIRNGADSDDVRVLFLDATNNLNFGRDATTTIASIGFFIGTAKTVTFNATTATFGGDVVSDIDSTDSLGTTTFRWANLFVDDITMTGAILGGAGSTAAATYGFSGDVGTGIFSRTATTVSITCGGEDQVEIQDTIVKLRSNVTLTWTNGASGTGIADVILSRGAANRLDLATGDSFVIQGGSLTVNETATATGDLRVEGESLQRLLATDASAASESVILLANTAPDTQEMDRGLFIGNATTIPTTSPVGGGFMFIEAGAATWLGTSGTETVFGAAGPRCGNCGYDFWRVVTRSRRFGAHLRECGMCETVYKKGPASVLDQLTVEEKKELIYA